MTYVIAEPCIDVKNQSCVDVCPVSCIYIGDETADRMLYINPDECIECGACEPECPVTAIFHDSAVPEEWAEFTELDARWCLGDENEKNAVRASPASDADKAALLAYFETAATSLINRPVWSPSEGASSLPLA